MMINRTSFRRAARVGIVLGRGKHLLNLSISQQQPPTITAAAAFKFNAIRCLFTSPFKDIEVPKLLDTYSLIFPSNKDNGINDQKTALIEFESGRTLSYKQFREETESLSNGLAHLYFPDLVNSSKTASSAETNPVVCIYAPNSIYYPVTVWASQRLGFSVSPSNPLYTTSEMVHQLMDSNATLLFTSINGLEVAREAAAIVGITEDRIILLEVPPLEPIGKDHQHHHHSHFKHRTLGDIIEFGKEQSVMVPKRVLSQKEIMTGPPAFLCYSSGTTGLAKGVMTSHDNILFNVHQMQSVSPYKNETLLLTLPCYHIYAMNLIMIWGLWQHCTIVVQPRFTLPTFLKAIETYKVTICHIVPPIALQMTKDPMVKDFNLSSIKETVCAAAPLGKELSQAYFKTVGSPIKQAYGMTELSPICHYTPSSKIKDGSVGVLMPNLEAKIMDADGNEITETGKEGELLVKGRIVMLGYLNNETATKNTIDSDGFIHTGDIARVDSDGYFEVVDRIKELIKYKGFPVIPTELENILLEMPDILDCAVIGIPDERVGEMPKAFVVRRQGSTITEEEIQKFVEGRVAQYKFLRGGVGFLGSIPKSAAGKILRRFLRTV